MEFLKELFSDKALTYDEFVQAINAHNGNEANKEKQIKIANLGSGEYVGKGKYDALNEQLTGKQTELDTANGLIAELKKASKGNEEMQGKISGYEQQVQQLQAQLKETKIKSALKVALLGEKALDIDYLTFKVNEKLKADGKSLELDENENIKGWDDIKSGLKTQFPKQFETAKNSANEVESFELPNTDQAGVITRSDLMKKPYAERAAFARENPEAYKEIMNH